MSVFDWFQGPSWKVVFSYVYDDERGRQQGYEFRFYADNLEQCLQRVHRVVRTRFSSSRHDSEDYLDIYLYDWDELQESPVVAGGPIEHVRYDAKELAVFWKEHAEQIREFLVNFQGIVEV